MHVKPQRNCYLSTTQCVMIVKNSIEEGGRGVLLPLSDD